MDFSRMDEFFFKFAIWRKNSFFSDQTSSTSIEFNYAAKFKITFVLPYSLLGTPLLVLDCLYGRSGNWCCSIVGAKITGDVGGADEHHNLQTKSAIKGIIICHLSRHCFVYFLISLITYEKFPLIKDIYDMKLLILRE